MLPLPYQFHQFFPVFAVIIITADSVAVIYNTVLTVSLQTGNPFIFTVPFGKQGKNVRFKICQNSFLTSLSQIAFVTMRIAFFHTALSHLTPLCACAVISVTAAAMCVFRTQKTRQPTARHFLFHSNHLLSPLYQRKGDIYMSYFFCIFFKICKNCSLYSMGERISALSPKDKTK